MEKQNKNVYDILQDQIDHDHDMEQINAISQQPADLAVSTVPDNSVENKPRDESHLSQSAFAVIEKEDEEEMEDLTHEAHDNTPRRFFVESKEEKKEK